MKKNLNKFCKYDITLNYFVCIIINVTEKIRYFFIKNDVDDDDGL